MDIFEDGAWIPGPTLPFMPWQQVRSFGAVFIPSTREVMICGGFDSSSHWHSLYSCFKVRGGVFLLQGEGRVYSCFKVRGGYIKEYVRAHV